MESKNVSSLDYRQKLSELPCTTPRGAAQLLAGVEQLGSCMVFAKRGANFVSNGAYTNYVITNTWKRICLSLQLGPLVSPYLDSSGLVRPGFALLFDDEEQKIFFGEEDIVRKQLFINNSNILHNEDLLGTQLSENLSLTMRWLMGVTSNSAV